jgi:hypothetical protein
MLPVPVEIGAVGHIFEKFQRLVIFLVKPLHIFNFVDKIGE